MNQRQKMNYAVYGEVIIALTSSPKTVLKAMSFHWRWWAVICLSEVFMQLTIHILPPCYISFYVGKSYLLKKWTVNGTQTQKKLCSLWRRYFKWLNVSKVVWEILCWKFLFDLMLRLGEVAIDQVKTLPVNNQWYIRQEITNIFKIYKSNAENDLHQFGFVSSLWCIM